MKLRKLNAKGFSHHFVMALVVLICAIGGTYYLVASHADAPQAQLSIAPVTPPNETTSLGSNVVLSVDVTTNGQAVSKFQSALSYPAADFTFVGMQPAVPITFNWNAATAGSIQFSGTAATPVNGADVKLATVTLKAISPGSAAVNLASLCPPTGEYPPTCSAAYGVPTTTKGSSTTGSSTTVTGPQNLLNSEDGYTYNILPTPQPPTNLTATVVSSSQINLTWTPSPNPAGYIEGYYLYRYSPNAGTSTTTLDATLNGPNTSSTSVTGLLAGSAYSFYLEAFTTSSPPSVSAQSNTALAAIPSAPVTPPIVVKPPTGGGTTSSAEQLSIPPQHRPAQYLSVCGVGKTVYVSDDTSNCWAGGSLIQNYSPGTVPGTYYDVPCVEDIPTAPVRFVYIATGETCPEQTTAVPLQLGAGEQASFPPAPRPASYLTVCAVGKTTYVALDSCVYRVPDSVYQFTYTPPQPGTYYDEACATITQGSLRYLYVSSVESCPENTFGNLSH